jgi:N6-L-threonylcarbamoyladenine synthase
MEPDVHTKILAIETSCDDTSVAIVQNGRRVLSNVLYSQSNVHQKYGGVLPEAAAREHLQTVNYCVQEALDLAAMELDDVDMMAATLGPGLVGSLLIGASVAKTLSFVSGKPFRGCHHLFGHVASNYLESDLEPPFLCLLVSGGHTQLVHVESFTRLTLLGETLDDAVGEAYDKIARLLGLPYPGGPFLDRLAKNGEPQAFSLPSPVVKNPYDFSFSGLKTATLRAYENACLSLNLTAREAEDLEGLPLHIQQQVREIKTNLAAAFQQTAVNILVEKTLRCAREKGLKTIAVAGGVAANSLLREKLTDFVAINPAYRLFIPDRSFCTDNAAMIASAAYFSPLTDTLERDVFSRMPLNDFDTISGK